MGDCCDIEPVKAQECVGKFKKRCWLSDEVYSRWPIAFPYMPSERPYKVYDRTFDSVNAERGFFDTVACLRIEEPDGTVHAINKFWKEVDDHFEEITKEEYDLRLESYMNKLAERGNNV